MKTIFTKLSAIYIGVLIIAYVLIMIGVNTVLQLYIVNQKAEIMIGQAKSIERIFTDAASTGVLNAEGLRGELGAFEQYVGSKALMMDRTGKVYVGTNDDAAVLNDSDMTAAEIESIFEGKTVTKQVTIPSLSKERILLVGNPIAFAGKTQFALFIYMTIPEIQKTAWGISSMIIIALLISAAIALMVLFFSTRRINKEINSLADVAKYISEGNFDKRIMNDSGSVLKELAESFNDMADELCKMEVSKRKFISNLSHDLRSPLTSITGYARAMLDGTIEADKQERYLNIILEESERLTKLTNDMLDLSKIQSGSMTLNKTDFDANEMLLHELEKFEARIVDKRLKLHIDLYKETLLAHGDVESIRRVIYNLLDNAVKFIDKEGTLGVKSEIKEDKILIGIQNSSPYIPAEKLQSIWNRFTKLDHSRGVEKNSSGLGLAIVKEILRAHDEKIEVYSNPEIGVIFVFSLTAQFFKDKATEPINH